MSKKDIWRDVNGIEKLPGSKDDGRRDYTEELPGKRDTPDYDDDEPAEEQVTDFV